MRHFSIAKLLLSLLIVVCLGVAVWSGYVLFTHKTNPIGGTVIFLVDIGILIWNIQVLHSRKYRQMKPSFKLVFLSVLGVFLVCAFAGVQPLAAYKNNVVNEVKESIVKLTGGENGQKQSVATTEIVDFQIKPRSAGAPMLALAEFYRELFGGERVTDRGDVFFEVKITPTSRVKANTTYFVTLMSMTGYIYDTKTVSWSEQDLAGPDPKERDISVIRAAEQRFSKVLRFVAPMSDKELNSMVVEYFELLERKDKNTFEAILRGDIKVWIGEEQERFRVTTSEKVRMANKYVKVIIAGEKSG